MWCWGCTHHSGASVSVTPPLPSNAPTGGDAARLACPCWALGSPLTMKRLLTWLLHGSGLRASHTQRVSTSHTACLYKHAGWLRPGWRGRVVRVSGGGRTQRDTCQTMCLDLPMSQHCLTPCSLARQPPHTGVPPPTLTRVIAGRHGSVRAGAEYRERGAVQHTSTGGFHHFQTAQPAPHDGCTRHCTQSTAVTRRASDGLLGIAE
jgi:hypothetical protein